MTLTSACASKSISLNEPPRSDQNSTIEQSYFGLLTLQQRRDAADSPSHAMKVSGFGLRWGTHTALGYFEEIRFSVPAGCKLVILVRNAQEAESISHLLKNSLKESPCAVLSPS